MEQERGSEMMLKSYMYTWLCNEAQSKAAAKNWMMAFSRWDFARVEMRHLQVKGLYVSSWWLKTMIVSCT